MMKNWIGAFVVLILLMSCKAKSVVATASATEDVAPDAVVSGHYANDKEFRILNVKADARYEDGSTSQNLTADIRIRKDEKILIIVRFLGITMAKALITPDQVKYYEKINGEYFEGDFTMLSKWLGTELDFNKVQNLFLGRPLDDLRKKPHDVSIDGKYYKIAMDLDGFRRSYFFEGAKYLLKRQEIEQTAANRSMSVHYPNYVEYPQMILPSGLALNAEQKKGKVKIEIDYKSATFNEDLSFAYSVPDGYDRIFID